VWKRFFTHFQNYFLNPVSEELSSVETFLFPLRFLSSQFRFQKNLVVWKPITSHCKLIILYSFQKNLVVWKLGYYIFPRDLRIRFQKNLVVWKRRLNPKGLVLLASFQKNLVVWKHFIINFFCLLFYIVSEELSSVETLLKNIFDCYYL